MIKLELSPSPLAPARDRTVEIDTPKRILVLVPVETDHSAATRRIWEIAHVANMQVLLLALCNNAAEEQSIQRQLITMASLLQNGDVCAETRIVRGTNWVQAVKTMYEDGDVIVCFAEQRTGLLQRPLSQILESNIKATLYVLSQSVPQKNGSHRYPAVFSWLGFLAILLGFGFLQTNILQLPESPIKSVLLILTILPEFWLIWVWNSLFG